MTPITAVFTAAVSGLAIRSRPGSAIGWLVFSMFAWPEYLRIPLGPLKLSAPRFVALILLLKFISGIRGRHFRWQILDTLVVFGWFWTAVANVAIGAPKTTVITMTGNVFQVVIPYFACRMALQSRADFKT